MDGKVDHLKTIAESTERIASLLASAIPPVKLGPITTVTIDTEEKDQYLKWFAEIQVPGKPAQIYSGSMKKGTSPIKGLFAAIHCATENFMMMPQQDKENIIFITNNVEVANTILPGSERKSEHSEQTNALILHLCSITGNWTTFYKANL